MILLYMCILTLILWTFTISIYKKYDGTTTLHREKLTVDINYALSNTSCHLPNGGHNEVKMSSETVNGMIVF